MLNDLLKWDELQYILAYHIMDLISAHLILYRRASLNTSLIKAVGVKIKNAKKVQVKISVFGSCLKLQVNTRYLVNLPFLT